MNQRLYEILSEHLTERKRNLFDDVANHRTRYITLILEDLYQAQNTSAIQRSAESWGLQDLYIIENAHSFTHHRRVAKGAYDWLDIHRFNESIDNSKSCIEHLKENGYQIVVTALHENAIDPDQLDLNKKTAVLMGTELTGASETAMKMADHFLKIPTCGFTESLNVGAAAAVIVHDLTRRMKREKKQWQLSDEEKLLLKIKWAKKSIHWSKYLTDMFEAGELK